MRTDFASNKTRTRCAIAGRYSTVVSQDEESAFHVFRFAEQLVGEDSYGGAWIDRTLSPPVLGLALVDPEAEQVSSIREVAKRAGWSLTIDVVKYSRAQLISFYDDLEGPDSTSVQGFGWDAQLNKVVVRLSAPDPQVTSYFRDHIPDDALLFRLVPFGRAVAL
jgi:hypothetical protein